MSNIQSGFVTPDGKIFATKKEAVDYLRKPQILASFMKLTGKNEELSAWFMENQENIEAVFDTGTIKRVTKSERKQLEKALEAVKAANEKAFNFVAENAAAIVESFRWPSVKRMDEAEKATAINAALVTLTEDNKDLISFITANKDAIFTCYESGKEKREVNPKAAEALAAFRAKKAAEKAAAK